MSIPHLFRCPISLDLFTDPVTLSTGQTYDRPSIEKWLAQGNSTCPVTMQRLDDATLVPNRTLRHLIDQWLLLSGPDHPSSRQKKAQPAPSGAGAGLSLAGLKQALQSADTAIATKVEILKKVRILSTESDIGQACLVQLGFFQQLLQMLFHTAGAVHEELVEVALDCVLSLLQSPSTQLELESLNILKKESRLASFLLLLDQGNPRIKTSLCCLLEMIATTSAAATRELCLILGQTPRVLQVLVSLLHDRGDARGASEAAARAISGICSADANRAGAVKEGAVDGLISYLANSGRGDDSRVLATLEVLVGLEAGKKALVKNSNAVKVLVKYVFRVSSSSSPSRDSNQEGESAVGVLLAACCESGKARAEAVNAGVLMQLLLLLQSQCGSKGKAKARALLKLLRSMWDRDPGMAAANLHNFK